MKLIAMFLEPSIPAIINKVSQKKYPKLKGVVLTEKHVFWDTLYYDYKVVK